jgi:hypothetical protein
VAVKARFAPHFHGDLAVSLADDDPVNADLLLRGEPRQADVYVYARYEHSIEWIDVAALRAAAAAWTPRRSGADHAPFVTTPYASLPPGVVLRCDPWPNLA